MQRGVPRGMPRMMPPAGMRRDSMWRDSMPRRMRGVEER
jgi:hypothetical protein